VKDEDEPTYSKASFWQSADPTAPEEEEVEDPGGVGGSFLQTMSPKVGGFEFRSPLLNRPACDTENDPQHSKICGLEGEPLDQTLQNSMPTRPWWL
jgi:hypothetical protein